MRIQLVNLYGNNLCFGELQLKPFHSNLVSQMQFAIMELHARSAQLMMKQRFTYLGLALLQDHYGYLLHGVSVFFFFIRFNLVMI